MEPAVARHFLFGRSRWSLTGGLRWWTAGVRTGRDAFKLTRREYPAQPLAAAAAVVVEAGRVLLVQRSRAPLAGSWSVPGGLIHLGETARAAAAREVREETGLEVEVGALLEVADRIEWDEYRQARFHYVIADFLARPVGGKLRAGDDAARAQWFEWEALAALTLTPGLAPVLAGARKAG